jgi:hypothetical protein
VTFAQDAEGTEDIYKLQLKTLETHRESKKGIEDDIREPNSIDWRAEHSWTIPGPFDWPGVDLVQRTLTAIEHQHTFVPRVGELVLFCPNFLHGHYLMLDAGRQEYKFYSFDQKCFHGFPTWRAGVVASIPSDTAADGPIDFPDIQNLPDKYTSLNTGGFRVETFPDPNNDQDKSASKQYRYLALRDIRPLTHWRILLRGISREKWHPSIEYALTCMTSMSLLEKFYFKGDWERDPDRPGTKKPRASIRSKGIYIGSELITVGDAVRILPAQEGAACTDVLVVESIRLVLSGIKPEHFNPDTPLLSSQSYITLVGNAYTVDENRAWEKASGLEPTTPTPVPAEDVKTIFRPVGAALYGPWYALHGPKQRYEISHDQILGRLCEGAAVQIWTGALQTKCAKEKNLKASLDYDLGGVQEGRKYATRTDCRLEEPTGPSLLWFWADTRAEALDIQTINGVEVGRYDTTRDSHTMELWNMQMKLLNGLPIDTIASKYTNFVGLDLQPDLDRSKGSGRKGRPLGSRMINGKLYRAGEIPPGFDKPLVIDESPDRSTPLIQLTPSKHKGSQMAGAALVSTDEDEDEDEISDQSDQDIFADARERRESSLGVPLVVPRGHDSPVPSVELKQKQPKTKAEIMASAVDDDSFSDDEGYDISRPLPERGGTEESVSVRPLISCQS